ncbi:MAG: hypothetical protein Q9191_000984 [Dirinaria sp. TL-2023a]
MRQPKHTNTKLPRRVLEDLGIEENTSKKYSLPRNRPGLRKEQRKAARVQKKSKKLPGSNDVVKHPAKLTSGKQATRASITSKLKEGDSDIKKPLKSILKTSKARDALPVEIAEQRLRSLSPPAAARPSKAVRDRLAVDDAEIAALEKALGLKGTQKLPASFKQDGLDELLEGLDDEGLHNGKRNMGDEDDWLRSKRLKAQNSKPAEPNNLAESISEASASMDDYTTEGSRSGDEFMAVQPSEDAGAIDEISEASSLPATSGKRHRENPYVAPVVPLDCDSAEKYVPPSLRGSKLSDSEDHLRLRRRIQGLLNRLSEANLLALVKDFEDLYRNHSRQDVSTSLIELLLDLLADPSNLQDTFVILHAGFIAALYKTVGSDFGAMAVSRVYDEFGKLYQANLEEGSPNKKARNLISLLAQLYNFRIIGSSLIYDLIRLFVENLSETNVELLLKITQSSGPQLRKDDSGSLKAINQLLQSTVASKNPESLSVRTNFMVETISNLANKGIKTAASQSAVTAEHIVRMRQILGSLNERNVKSSEPLGITLKDLKELDKRGKWWLIGASFRDEEQKVADEPSKRTLGDHGEELGRHSISTTDADFSRIARHLGMNTDVRRSILTTVLSADDYEAAYKQLQKLPLNSSQRREIPRVLIRCSSAQEEYNPFFTLLARRLISAEPRMSKAFQFSLWSLFDTMRDAPDHGQQDQQDGSQGQLELRGVINVARMYGTLIAQDGVNVRVLKDLNFGYLTGKLRLFVELLLATTILQSQEEAGGGRNEKRIMDIFLKTKETPGMARGLQYFLKKVVSKTDIIGSKEKIETVKWGCQVARHSLNAVASME